MNFRTEIRAQDVDIHNPHSLLPQLKGLEEGSDYDIEPRTFYVSWNCELEVREWGVKDINWFVTNIEGEFEVLYFNEKGDEYKSEVVVFDFEPFKDKTDMNVDLDHRSISIDALEIDYADSTAVVS